MACRPRRHSRTGKRLLKAIDPQRQEIGRSGDGWRYAGFTRKTVDAETDGTFHWGYFLPLAWSTAAFSSGSSTIDKVRSNTLSAIFRRTWGSRIEFSTHCLPRAEVTYKLPLYTAHQIVTE